MACSRHAYHFLKLYKLLGYRAWFSRMKCTTYTTFHASWTVAWVFCCLPYLALVHPMQGNTISDLHWQWPLHIIMSVQKDCCVAWHQLIMVIHHIRHHTAKYWKYLGCNNRGYCLCLGAGIPQSAHCRWLWLSLRQCFGGSLLCRSLAFRNHFSITA